MSKLPRFFILGPGNAAHTQATLMALLGSLSFALRVLVEVIRHRRKAVCQPTLVCPACAVAVPHPRTQDTTETDTPPPLAQTG